MRQIVRTIIWTAAAVALAACARGAPEPGEVVLDDDLRRDLALASGDGLALAAQSFEPTRFVSAVEGGRASTPSAPRAVRRPQPRPARQAPSPAPIEAGDDGAEAAVATTSTDAELVSEQTGTVEVTQGTAEEPAPATVPTAGPAEAERPSTGASAGSGRGEGRGRGVGIGTVIGVIGAVMRGGSVSGGVDDDCELHHPRRGRSRGPQVLGGPRIGGPVLGPVIAGAVNERMRGRGPMIGQSTFPR